MAPIRRLRDVRENDETAGGTVTKQRSRFRAFALAAALLLTASASAQITTENYDRANRLRTRFQGLAVNISETPNAIPNTSRFWYRKSVQGGNEFVLVDAEKRTKGPAFDHAKLAASLSTASAGRYELCLSRRSGLSTVSERSNSV
jgi:hypothetical protein